MEFLQLKYFCCAARTENFSVVARKFSVPSSDISQSIKRLERELGVSLFDRRSNSLSLNEKGKYFYEKANRALMLLEDAKAHMSEVQCVKKIGLCVLSNRRVVMQTIEKFRRLYPYIDISVRYEIGAQMDFDFIVTCNLPPKRTEEWEKLMTEDLLLAVSAEDPLAHAIKTNKDDLSKANFISMGDNSNLYQITNQICEDMGFKPNIVIQSDDPFYVRKCVEMGLGVAIVPAISWRGQYSDRIILLPLKGYKRSCYLFQRKSSSSSELYDLFANMLKEEFYNEEKNWLESKCP